ncbi:GTPase [uncultured Vibrio sp.]|uniref:GTPase family protein n=1 Tax=uncultured Vibrio sp. TaxID=114054 RepID=UPI0025EC71DD|nr:GTPase [uncultured Vibrio sp.]
MTKWSKIRQVLAHLAEGGVGFGLALAVMPTLVVACFGFYLSFKYGYLIELSITLMALSVLGLTPILWLRLTAKKSVLETVEEAESDFVKASSDWSERENDLWNNAKVHANTLLEKDDEWASLYVHGLRVVEHVAKQYGKSELEFTLPEGLQLLEEVSFRYRKTLVEHIPAIESIKVSHIKWVYEVQDKYGDDALTAAKFANLGRMAYLAYANPIKLINDEIRNKILASESSSRYSAIQINAKRALLHEVASVSLDLYSGRFTVSAADVKASDVSANDELNEASPLEPIRVVLVGQTSSGKSSFVNRFLGEFSAEVDELPSSEGITTYSFNDNDLNPLRIIDLQGLDGKDETNKRTLQEMVNADIVVWLLKANQSARQLDHTLRQAFDQFYSEDKNLTHKRPVLFGVVSQVDRLSPQPEWSPPYSTEKPTGEKAKNIAAALKYNQALLKFDEIYPLSIDRKWPVDSPMSSENAEFGFDLIKERLSRHYDTAKNIQRNRQRRDSKSKRTTLVDQTKRLYKSTQTAFRHSKIEKEKK